LTAKKTSGIIKKMPV